MVRNHSDTQKIDDLFMRNISSEYSENEKIKIESDFQRGDEQIGVWSSKEKARYIDSLQKKYPTGIFTFVKDHTNATSYNNSWNVLDGGNRLRSIRDYKNNKFVDRNNKKYEDLEHEVRLNFDSIQVPCQWLRIEREDPDDTIAEMFCRLNTSAKSLSNGELFKAHGWKKNIWEIELAKKIVGHKWSSNISYPDRFDDLTIKWELTFSKLLETNRCDTLAMMIGYILSAKTSKFNIFDKRYKNIKGELSTPDDCVRDEDLQIIYSKLNEYLDIMQTIYSKTVFGNVTKGMPAQTKVATVWKRICENKMTPDFRKKIIIFFKDELLIKKNLELKRGYDEILNEGSNGETSDYKIDIAIKYIEDKITL